MSPVVSTIIVLISVVGIPGIMLLIEMIKEYFN